LRRECRSRSEIWQKFYITRVAVGAADDIFAMDLSRLPGIALKSTKKCHNASFKDQLEVLFILSHSETIFKAIVALLNLCSKFSS
jgi:predicted component of type VI protein secretion system